jgi:Ca2+-binding RTX toxin-like protein
MAIKIGTSGHDSIYGMAETDSIYGYEGQDFIFSGGGSG